MSSPLDGNGVAAAAKALGFEMDMEPDEMRDAASATVAAYLASAAPSHTAVEPVGELVRKLLSYCMDWNDEPMADAEEPRVMPYCGELRQAASTLTAQAAALVAAEKRIAELEAGLDAAEAYNEEHGDPADTLHHGRSVLAHARRRTHQEKNNAG